MDCENICILISKGNSFEDRTADIISIAPTPDGRFCSVTFHDGRSYTYSSTKVRILKDPKTLDLSSCILLLDGRILSNVDTALDFGPVLKVRYRNSPGYRTYESSRIKVRKNLRASGFHRQVLDYLTQVASLVGIKEDEEGDPSYLYRQLEHLELDEDSVLALLLSGTVSYRIHIQEPLIAPWRVNESQLVAIRKALECKVSVIQGPPGTGKTQTILNIIANCLVRGMSVAVASGNNEAIRNVYDKMCEARLGSACAFLGRKANVESFFSENRSEETVSCIHRLSDRELMETASIVSNVLSGRRLIAQKRQERDELEREAAVFESEYGDLKDRACPSLLSLDTDWKGAIELSAAIEVLSSKKKVSIIDRVRLRLKYGLRRTREVLANADVSIQYLQQKYYRLKLEALQEEIDNLASLLEKGESILASYSSLSMDELKFQLERRQKETGQLKFSRDDYRRRFQEFARKYPVVFSTTHSLSSCTARGFLYDILIVDEASQVDLASAALALSKAKALVCVGDSKQLPHVVRSSQRNDLESLFASSMLPEFFDWTTHSLLDTANVLVRGKDAQTLLNEHYRCDSEIIGFSNARFYDSQLIICTEHSEDGGFKLVQTPPHWEHDRKNEGQCKLIFDSILPTLPTDDVGIVTPYRNQVELLQGQPHSKSLLIDTVHKFQGKERDIMIMSTVSDRVRRMEDNENSDFLNDPNLINVALTRAKNRLYIVASSELVSQQGTILNDLARYLSYRHPDALKKEECPVYTVFDLMYSDYSKELEEMKKHLMKVSEYESENIMATLLEEMRKDETGTPFSYVVHYPLFRLVKTGGISDEDDRKFASNHLTHCDFVLYSNLDKKPSLS